MGCITHARLGRRYGRRGSDLAITLQLTGAPVTGSIGMGPWSIDIALTLDADAAAESSERHGPPRPYEFALLDRKGTELLAYHLHPGAEFPGPDHPHVHVSAALRPARADGDRAVLSLDKLHLATGPVALAAFVRMLVEEFGVRPLVTDWRGRLDGAG